MKNKKEPSVQISHNIATDHNYIKRLSKHNVNIGRKMPRKKTIKTTRLFQKKKDIKIRNRK